MEQLVDNEIINCIINMYNLNFLFEDNYETAVYVIYNVAISKGMTQIFIELKVSYFAMKLLNKSKDRALDQYLLSILFVLLKEGQNNAQLCVSEENRKREARRELQRREKEAAKRRKEESKMKERSSANNNNYLDNDEPPSVLDSTPQLFEQSYNNLSFADSSGDDSEDYMPIETASDLFNKALLRNKVLNQIEPLLQDDDLFELDKNSSKIVCTLYNRVFNRYINPYIKLKCKEFFEERAREIRDIAQEINGSSIDKDYDSCEYDSDG